MGTPPWNPITPGSGPHAWNPATHPYGPGGPHIAQIFAVEQERARKEEEKAEELVLNLLLLHP